VSRNQDAWEKLYNAGGIYPSLNPKNLSNVLRDVGVNRAGQDVVFKGLTDMSKQLVYDLSSVFSCSMSISQAEKGYNNFKVSLGFFLMNNHISKNISPSYCLYIPFC